MAVDQQGQSPMLRMAKGMSYSSGALLEHAAHSQTIGICHSSGQPQLHLSAQSAKNILLLPPSPLVIVDLSGFHIFLHELLATHTLHPLSLGTSSRVTKTPSCIACHSR